MGLSFHYNGYIKNREDIPALVEETADICSSMNWKHRFISNEELEGLCFSPENSEPVFLTFTPEGRLCSPVNLMMKDIYDGEQLDRELLFTTSTKTQYAGAEAHMAIMRLLRYLGKKYFSVFEVSDEGCFWETDDPKILQKQFGRYNAALDAVTGVLSNLDAVPGETPASLVERIERVLRNMQGKGQ